VYQCQDASPSVKKVVGNSRHLVSGTLEKSFVVAIRRAVEIFGQRKSTEGSDIGDDILKQTASTEMVHIDNSAFTTIPALGTLAGVWGSSRVHNSESIVKCVCGRRSNLAYEQNRVKLLYRVNRIPGDWRMGGCKNRTIPSLKERACACKGYL